MFIWKEGLSLQMKQMKQAILGATAGALVVGGIWFLTNAAGNTVATVGNTKITKAAFQKELEKYGGSMVLRELIADQLILDGAKKYNLTVSDQEVENEIANLRSQYPSEEQFQLSLSQNNVTLDDLKEKARINLLLEKLAEKDVTVSEAEMQQYFAQHKADFNQPEQVRASHILVSTLEEANQVEARLKKGEDFAKVAKEVSKDPSSASKGGDLGYFGKGKMVPAFEQAAFSLKVGEISQPVKTPYGYHIIKVIDHKQAKEATFAEAKSQIEAILKKQKAKQPDQVLEELRQEDPVQIVWPQYKNLFSNDSGTGAGGSTGSAVTAP